MLNDKHLPGGPSAGVMHGKRPAMLSRSSICGYPLPKRAMGWLTNRSANSANTPHSTRAYKSSSDQLREAKFFHSPTVDHGWTGLSNWNLQWGWFWWSISAVWFELISQMLLGCRKIRFSLPVSVRVSLLLPCPCLHQKQDSSLEEKAWIWCYMIGPTRCVEKLPKAEISRRVSEMLLFLPFVNRYKTLLCVDDG